MEFILISHGDLAKSMLGSAQMIIGEQTDVQAFGLYPKDDIGELKEKIRNAIQASKEKEIICFTDLFSGSPFNAVVSIMGEYPIRHITGMNLPMILEAFMMRCNPENSQETICKKLIEQAPESFIDVNHFLEVKLND